MNQDIRDYIEKWIFRANEDVSVCLKLKETDAEQYASTICFHAQQAVEKFFKAFLTYNKVDFPRTHDVDYLLSECSKINQGAFSLIELKDLSEFGVTVRYPDDFYLPDKEEVDFYINAMLIVKETIDKLILF